MSKQANKQRCSLFKQVLLKTVNIVHFLNMFFSFSLFPLLLIFWCNFMVSDQGLYFHITVISCALTLINGNLPFAVSQCTLVIGNLRFICRSFFWLHKPWNMGCILTSPTSVAHLKGTRCLGSVELVFEKRSVTVCCKMYMVGKIL